MPFIIFIIAYIIVSNTYKVYYSERSTGLLLLSVIGIVLWWAYPGWKKYNLEQKRLLEAKIAEEDRLIKAHRDQQHSFYTQLVEVSTTSLEQFEKMPAYLLSSEDWLDQAEQDFKEGVFAPFWDSIEKATFQLGHFDSSTQNIIYNSKKYTELATKYEAHTPRFPIAIESVRAMTTAKTTSERLRLMVRKAQSNPHFAMIYEQRRTNQLLVAGFSNLGQALDRLGQQISFSIDSLNDQISQMSSTLENSLSMVQEQIQTSNELNSKLIESVDNHHSTAKKEASDQAERHNLALSRLDNIQRHRKPGIFDR